MSTTILLIRGNNVEKILLIGGTNVDRGGQMSMGPPWGRGRLGGQCGG